MCMLIYPRVSWRTNFPKVLATLDMISRDYKWVIVDIATYYPAAEILRAFG